MIERMSEEHICDNHKPNKCIVATYQYQREQAVLNHLLEIYNKGIKDYFNEKIKENKKCQIQKTKAQIIH